MTLISFPGPFIYIHEIVNHVKWKQFVLNAVSLHETKHGCFSTETVEKNTNIYTDFFSPHKIPQFYDSEFVNEIIWQPLDAALSEVQLANYPSESQLANIWYNKITGLGWHSAHNHPGAEWCGIYIVDLQELNPTVFQHNFGNSAAFSTTLSTTESVREGAVIIFPGFLSHWVNPVQTQHRLTVSFNITSTYQNKKY